MTLSKGTNYVELCLEYEKIEKDMAERNKYVQEKMALLSSMQAAANIRNE